MEPLGKSDGMLFESADLKSGSRHARIPPWGEAVHAQFAAAILDPKFPCTFAALGLAEGWYRFAFIPAPHAARCPHELAVAMAEYLQWLKTVPADKDMYAVLVVFCAPIDGMSQQEYRDAFEKLLTEANLRDPAPWPDRVPRNADDPKFSFCFGGREIFVNANTPSHHRRRSRNLGPSLTLVIQPRDVFDKIGSAKVRESIRSRIAGFDGMAASPEIGVYGDPQNREYAGYFLSEDNQKAAARMASPGRCPFAAASAKARKFSMGVTNLLHRLGAFF